MDGYLVIFVLLAIGCVWVQYINRVRPLPEASYPSVGFEHGQLATATALRVD